jgi:hypothetical protein
MILTALIGLGAVGLAVVHFSRDSRDDRLAQAETPAPARASPFGPVAAARSNSVTPPKRSAFAGAERREADEPPTVRERPPESDADPADVPTDPADFPTYDESGVQLGDEHQVPADKAGLTEADARAAALREIETPSPASFSALEQTLRSDPTARNRLLAVKSLRLLGKQWNNAERARAALRVAMSDADQNVSTNARDAYDELAR